MNIFKENKRYLIATIILTTFAVLINAFIILQASLNGSMSTESSGRVVTLLKNIINSLSENAINDSNIGDFTYFVRKLVGHFGLFAVSGLFTSWSFYLWIKPQTWYKPYRCIYMSLGFGFSLALLTELIQLFVPGRSGEFTDSLIDFFGYILTTGIIVLIALVQYKKEHHIENEEDFSSH